MGTHKPRESSLSLLARCRVMRASQAGSQGQATEANCQLWPNATKKYSRPKGDRHKQTSYLGEAQLHPCSDSHAYGYAVFHNNIELPPPHWRHLPTCRLLAHVQAVFLPLYASGSYFVTSCCSSSTCMMHQCNAEGL